MGYRRFYLCHRMAVGYLIASSAIRFQIRKGLIFELPQLPNMNYQMRNFVHCNWGDSLEPFRSLKVGTNDPYQY